MVPLHSLYHLRPELQFMIWSYTCYDFFLSRVWLIFKYIMLQSFDVHAVYLCYVD